MKELFMKPQWITGSIACVRSFSVGVLCVFCILIVWTFFALPNFCAFAQQKTLQLATQDTGFVALTRFTMIQWERRKETEKGLYNLVFFIHLVTLFLNEKKLHHILKEA